MGTSQRRYLVALKSNPLDESSRLEWGGNDGDLDRLIAKAYAERKGREIVLLTEYGADDKVAGRWVVEADGRRVEV